MKRRWAKATDGAARGNRAAGRRAWVVVPAIALVTAVSGDSIDYDPIAYAERTPMGQVPFGKVQIVHNAFGANSKGFGLIAFYGAGCGWGYKFAMLPVGDRALTTGDVKPDLFHKDNSVSTKRYSGTGAKMYLSWTHHGAVGHFSYTSTDNGLGHFLIRRVEEVEVVGDREILGKATLENFCGRGGGTDSLFFYLTFDRPFSKFGLLGSDFSLRPDVRKGKAPGGYVSFAVAPDDTIRCKLALSYVGFENAKLNIMTEVPGWDEHAVKERSEAVWRDKLNAIRIEGGLEPLRKQFARYVQPICYHPNGLSDVNGDYMGFDELRHNNPSHIQYGNYSGWDTYRCWLPLVAWLYPEECGRMMQTLVNYADEGGGGYPHWPYGYHESSTMEGDPGSVMVAWAHAFGARDFDLHGALRACHRTASDPTVTTSKGFYARHGLRDYLEKGYVIKGGPNDAPSSTTLEYALADYAISRFAYALGDSVLGGFYARRSQCYKTIWRQDEKILMIPTARDSYHQFAEGGPNQFVWMVPQSPRNLFELMGGKQAAAERLDNHFTGTACDRNDCHTIGNEHGLLPPWLYNWMDQPWKTQAKVREIIFSRFFTLNAKTGEYRVANPGQDDMGTLSSWAIWAMMGLYPVIPGEPGLTIGSPLFPKMVIRLGGGRTLTIIGNGAADDAPYVQSLAVNGSSHTSTWLPLALLDKKDNVLEFTLGNSPNTSWGTGPNNEPPSYDAEPLYGNDLTIPPVGIRTVNAVRRAPNVLTVRGDMIVVPADWLSGPRPLMLHDVAGRRITHTMVRDARDGHVALTLPRAAGVRVLAYRGEAGPIVRKVLMR